MRAKSMTPKALSRNSKRASAPVTRHSSLKKKRYIMHKLITPLLAVLLLLSLSSCKMFKKPTVDRIHDLKIISMTPDQTNILISLKVNNPNSYKLVVKELKVSLLDKDRVAVGNAVMSKQIMIPGRKSTAVDFNVKLDTRKTAKMISHADQVLFFYIQGQGKGRALGCTKKLQFEEPYELKIKDYISDLLPKFTAGGSDLFKVQKTHISKLGIGQTQVQTDFMLLNPYGLTFTFKGFPADVYVNEKIVGKANLGTQLYFNENVYSKDGNIQLEINNFKSLVEAVKGAVKGEIDYKVKGTVIIDAFGMEIKNPYEFKGSIPFNLQELIF